MKKTFSIICIPFALKEGNEMIARFIEGGFDTEQEAEKWLSTSEALEASEDMPWILAIVPNYHRVLTTV